MKERAFTISPITHEDETPHIDHVSAVFLVAFQDGKVLSTKNERGWDVPGGHLEGDESLLAGLQREVQEECGATFSEAKPFAALSSERHTKVMVFFVTSHVELGEFTTSEDVLDRDFLTIDELIFRYYGDEDLLREILTSAQRFV